MLCKTKYPIAFAAAIFFVASIPIITTYGPEVQGRRNKLTNKPMIKAPGGVIMFQINDFIFGRQERGISIKNTFPYQK